MKKIYSFLFGAIITCNGLAQDYTLNPTALIVQGNPGDFLLSTLIVNNPSSNAISIHVERIVRNLPPNWNSCFCFPWCVAPFIDTITFSIAPFSMDSIKPNYNTDPNTPGIGYITITLYQVGYPNAIDTITFSGSTMPAGINEASFSSNLSLFPNPFASTLTIKNSNSDSYSFSIFNSTGEILFRKENVSSFSETVDLAFLSEGIYFIKSEFTSEKTVSIAVIKTK